MEIMKQIYFEIDGELMDVCVKNLLIWRISDLTFNSLKLRETNNYKILGVNYRDPKLTKSILATSFKEEQKSLGISTINFLSQNLKNYNLGILYPAGYDVNSIEYIIEKGEKMPLLVLLNSATFYKLFADDSYGQVYEYKNLTRNNVPIFKIS